MPDSSLKVMFQYQICDKWRRIRPQGDGETVFTEPRPHLIPTMKIEDNLIGVDSFGAIGRTGLCPGEVFVNGQWKPAYRFQKLTESDAQSLIEQLEEQIFELMRNAR